MPAAWGVVIRGAGPAVTGCEDEDLREGENEGEGAGEGKGAVERP